MVDYARLNSKRSKSLFRVMCKEERSKHSRYGSSARLLQHSEKMYALEMCPSCYDLLILQRKSKRCSIYCICLPHCSKKVHSEAERGEASLVSAWKTNAMNAALDSHARLESNSDKIAVHCIFLCTRITIT